MSHLHFNGRFKDFKETLYFIKRWGKEIFDWAVKGDSINKKKVDVKFEAFAGSFWLSDEETYELIERSK